MKVRLHCYIQPNNYQYLGQISARFVCMVSKSLCEQVINSWVFWGRQALTRPKPDKGLGICSVPIWYSKLLLSPLLFLNNIVKIKVNMWFSVVVFASHVNSREKFMPWTCLHIQLQNLIRKKNIMWKNSRREN